MLKRNSIKVHSNTRPHTDSSHYRNENRLAVWVILEMFWIVSLKAHDWSSWILTECNFSWKSVKYRILSEVCMINSTVSPQMWCIKSIKGWSTHLNVGKNYFVKYTCRTQKILPDLFSKNLFSRPNLQRSWMWSKMFAIFWVYI